MLRRFNFCSSKVTAVACLATVLVTGCSTVKYNTREEIGDALERFGSVVEIEETGLKKAYDRLSDEYDDSKDAAEDVSDEIDDVEDVAGALFKEWNEEIKLYSDPNLKQNSQDQLRDTQARYKEMLASMQAAERSMEPVLKTFRDNVLFLKHNLNAQAVGSLKGTFQNLEGDIDRLIERMNQSIDRSNQFIAEMRPG